MINRTQTHMSYSEIETCMNNRTHQRMSWTEPEFLNEKSHKAARATNTGRRYKPSSKI